MSTRVIVPQRAAEGPTAPASSHDLGQKVKAAVAVGGFVTIGLWVVGLVLALMGWEGFLVIFGLGGPVIGLLITCWFGISWSIAAASRPWQVDDLVRSRMWTIEDEERSRQLLAAEAARDDVVSGDLDHDRDPSTLNDAQRLHLLAFDILERHFLDESPTTREAMVAEGVCTQPEWNVVNSLLKAVGLKRGYSLREDLDFAAAWRIWRGSVSIEDSRAWVKNGPGREMSFELEG